jgi:quinol monooxygenase YgiN
MRAILKKELIMTKYAIVARLVAKAGKEEEVAAFLASALPLAQAEPATIVWFALRFSKSEFGIFDAFPDEAGRKAHLDGPIAAALMAKAADLLASPPKLEMVDLLASKLGA